ncbi:MAG: endolytic transglycosylase MltG [Candidatus Moranbacteria bacterium]|nr:endolytic transglycosylase MltG [Candidatus Moranbacteria bacterium]
MFKKIAQTLLVILILVSAVFYYFDRKMHGRKSHSPVEQEFVVTSGQGVNQISGRLQEQGLISNSLYFDLYIWRIGREEKIVTGAYTLRPNMTIPEIVDILTTGKNLAPKDIKITIIEGWSNKKIAQYLTEKNILSAEEFKKETGAVEKYQEQYSFLQDLEPKKDTLEGFLFPDTYLIYPDSTPAMVISKFLNNFDKKLTDTMRQDIQASGHSIKEVVIMASIIEREVRDPKDQKIVSGLFWNRLQDRHPLQSCATINYILGNNKEKLSYEDTRIQSPYNTYLNKGLPPGPISNPGINALMAAIYPQESDYYYFLNKPDGEIIYSRTIDEHKVNKDKYGL